MRAADVNDAKDRKTLAFLAEAAPATRVLVVGCGDGREAGLIAHRLKAEVFGIGFDDGRFDHDAAAPATLIHMDAQELAFEDASFDLVYSFHALEHIPDPVQALREMRRVLVPGGQYLVGTPNSSRLVGYLGAAEPLSQRLRSNLTDYRMRATGRWSNEAGAHAGFTRQQLRQLCATHIGPVEDATDRYYERLYPSRRRQLRALRRLGLADRLHPAAYVTGRRAG